MTTPSKANIEQHPRHPSDSAGLNLEPGSHDDGWETPDPVTLGDGTRIQLYKDGEALRAAYDAIANATKRVCVEIYILRNDATGKAFTELLARRAREGIKVYLIYDGLGSLEASDLVHMMKQAGVHVAEFHPVWPWRCKFGWRPWNRDHRKLLVVDDDVGGIGGLNIGDEYGGSWIAGDQAKLEGLMRDQAIGIIGPAARVLLKSFIASWRYVHEGGRLRKCLFTHNIDINTPKRSRRPGKRRLQARGRHPALLGDFALLASAPTLDSPLRPVLAELFKNAKQSITVLMAYFAPDDELINNLCDAAERGVRTRLILPERSDLKIMVIAARSFYTRLLDCGVEVYERREAVLHAKTLLVDDKIVMIGSTNLDYRSTEINLEASALITSKTFGKQMRLLLDHDVRFSHRVAKETWRRRPTRDRIVQWLVSRARYLL